MQDLVQAKSAFYLILTNGSYTRQSVECVRTIWTHIHACAFLYQFKTIVDVYFSARHQLPRINMQPVQINNLVVVDP